MSNAGVPNAARGLRSESVRQSNLSAILRDLHLRGAASRSELVVHTGLTRSSVGALVGELTQSGLVFEDPAVSDGSPGRPSPVVRTDARRNVVLALEAAVDFISGAFVGLGGQMLAVHRVDRSRERASVDATVRDLVELTEQLGTLYDAPAEPIAIGVAVAGLVRRRDNVVAVAPNLGWHDVPFGDLLAEALPYRAPMVMANEGDLAALAETRRGVAVGVGDVLFLSGEVGVGGGLVSGGRSIVGSAGFAGEIGHMLVNADDGRPCRCGATGCWETEVGEGSLLRRANRPPDGGRRGVGEVLGAAAAGDGAALEALAAEAQWLAIGLGGLINVLNPRLIVFGGFFGRIYSFVIDDLRAALAYHALAPAIDDLEILPSALALEGPLVGAAELAFEPLLDDPLGYRRSRAKRARS